MDNHYMCGGLVIVVILNFGISTFVILILVCETYSYHYGAWFDMAYQAYAGAHTHTPA